MSAAEPLVLVVDDDDAMRKALQRALSLEGFSVVCASGGKAALAAVEQLRPSALLLDVTMPDLNGTEVARRLRAEGNTTPICMLSARDEVEDRILGLEAGADDYVVKPFAFGEVVARLHALLRRLPPAEDRPLSWQDLRLDPSTRAARRGDRDLDLTRREFDLLHALLREPGVVRSRKQLLGEVWGYWFETDTNVVDVFVSYLRRKLEAAGEPRVVHTVRGIGFVLRP